MEFTETREPGEFKPFLYEQCMAMIKDLQEKQMQIMEIYKSNPTFPFDFYNLSLREADTKIAAVRELYQQATGEELQ